MKFLIRNHKDRTPRYEGTQDWILEVGGDSPDAHKLEEILNIKNVEEYKEK
tara:strand:+ start:267 stop:419 length:153 start_codon:yes stop_codon:yes gene_type:complete